MKWTEQERRKQEEAHDMCVIELDGKRTDEWANARASPYDCARIHTRTVSAAFFLPFYIFFTRSVAADVKWHAMCIFFGAVPILLIFRYVCSLHSRSLALRRRLHELFSIVILEKDPVDLGFCTLNM